jgi:hypothetical protein
VLAGFRLERTIGRGSRSVVYEATQLSLDRRVAFKLLRPEPDLLERFGGLRWPEHRHAVALYATGACEHGVYVAMRLVRGCSLGELNEEGAVPTARAVGLLEQVAGALDAAHEDGIVHGALGAGSVLVDADDRAFVTDFGLGHDAGTAEADLIAFARLTGKCLELDGDSLVAGRPPSAAAVVSSAADRLPPSVLARRPPARRRRRALAGALCAAVGAAVLAIALAGPRREPEGAPRVLAQAMVLGSSLPSTGVESLDCSGQAPSGSSQACTVVQTRLPGRTPVAPRDGEIRRWTVRGARGELALQVLRPRGERYLSAARTAYERVTDTGVHTFAANVPIRAGDLVGVEVTPGAAIGVRPRVSDATTARWFGPLIIDARAPEQRARSGFDYELLLRVEYMPESARGRAGRLTSPAAKRAPAGAELGERGVELRGGQVRRVVVVRAPGTVAVDLFDGSRRLERLAVSDVDPAGRLLGLSTLGRPLLRLRWRNPDGRLLTHDYSVRSRSLVVAR